MAEEKRLSGKWRPWLFTLGAILFLIFAGSRYAKYTVCQQLDSVPGLSYDNLSMSLWKGTCQMQGVRFGKDGSDYQFAVHSVDFNYWNNKVVIDSLAMVPLYAKANWAQHFKYKKSRLDLRFPRIEISGIAFRKCIDQKRFEAENVILENASLEVFIDKSKPICPDCYKAFPHEKLKALPFVVDIKKLEIKAGDIQVNIEKVHQGSIDFNQVYASIYDITNDSLGQTEPTKIIADVKAVFMDKTDMDVHFTFDQYDPEYAYSYDATLGAMDLVRLNEILKVKDKLNIISGEMQSAKINVNGNRQLAQGEMTMQYKDFKMELLDQEKGKPKKFLSALLNTLVVNKNNVVESSSYKKGKIYYPAEKNRSIYHQWAHSALTGVKSILLPDILLSDNLGSEKVK